MTVHVELQEGWDGRPVVVTVDGAPAARLTPRTRLQTGLADVVTLDLAPGPHTVTVRRPDDGAAFEARVDGDGDTWVGVSVSSEGTVTGRLQSTPFGYV